MTRKHKIQRESAQSTPSGVLRLQFGKDTAFQLELQRRVEEHFRSTGKRKRDCWPMYLKTAIILACFATCYALLVFVAQTVWQGLSLTVLLAVLTAAIGFNVQHDGGHQAYSDRPWVNKLMAMTMDMIGGSSYVWRWKHAIIHHRYVNIDGYDTDIDLGILGRMAPHQRRLAFHRWQHFYLWPLYGFLAIKWHFATDFRNVLAARIGPHGIPRPQGWDLVIFLGGKAVFFTWAFVVPLLLHPLKAVLFCYVVAAVVLGLLLSLIFQLPHCVEEAAFPLPQKDTGMMENPWAVHQVQVTLDFSQQNRVITWFLGGLNYHKEHHLFPLICHVHYPAISKLVEETCRDFGISYKAHQSFPAGLAAHYRWLRLMGSPGSDEPRPNG
jgi:linoleoyl-CoA desaturase